MITMKKLFGKSKLVGFVIKKNKIGQSRARDRQSNLELFYPRSLTVQYLIATRYLDMRGQNQILIAIGTYL